MIKWWAAAACVCILAVGGLAFRNSLIEGGSPLIISSGDSGLVSGIYAAPENGKIIFQTDVRAALDENIQEDVLYFIVIYLFQDEKPLSPESDVAQTELERLAGHGYKVMYATAWTYQNEGEKVGLRYLAGYFTKKQLETFAASPLLGYSFSFATNGDGSPVTPEQGPVSEFNSMH